MRSIGQRFVPLEANEAPGAPDLGGWRPLPRSLFAMSTRGQAPTDATTKVNELPTWQMLSIRQAVELVGLMVNIAAVSDAISTVVKRLRAREDTIVV